MLVTETGSHGVEWSVWGLAATPAVGSQPWSGGRWRAISTARVMVKRAEPPLRPDKQVDIRRTADTFSAPQYDHCPGLRAAQCPRPPPANGNQRDTPAISRPDERATPFDKSGPGHIKLETSPAKTLSDVLLQLCGKM